MDIILAEACRVAALETYEQERAVLLWMQASRCDQVSIRQQAEKMTQAFEEWKAARWAWLDILYPGQNRVFADEEIEAAFSQDFEQWEFPPLEEH